MTRFDGMPEDVYHARTELSSTGARRLLESPARFRWDADHPQKHSDAFDVGTAVHSMVLGTGAQAVKYPGEHLTPRGAVSTKTETQVWAEEQRRQGMVPLHPTQYKHVTGMAESLLAHPTARAFLEAAPSREVTFVSDIDGVPVRCRFDALTDQTPYGRVVGVDLKTTAKTADEKGFTRSVVDYGYHVQAGHYDDTYEASVGQPLDDFVFLVVEKSAPYLVGVHRLVEQWMSMGKTAAAEARKRFAHGTATGEWPGYPTDVHQIAPPLYAVIDHEEKYDPLGLTFGLEEGQRMDVTEAILAKSDQLNAQDLVQPTVVQIMDVKPGPKDQPVHIVTDVFGAEHPFKPSKSVLRDLAKAWGKETAVWVGRWMRLYNETTVLWAGKAVGGIRIDALSHITEPIQTAHTITRGKYKEVTINVLHPPVDHRAALAAAKTLQELQAAWLAAVEAQVASDPELVALKDARKEELA